MKKAKMFVEAIILLICTLALTFISIRIDLFDIIHNFTRPHEIWELDEILLGMPILTLALLIFVVLRIRDIHTEIRLRRAAELKVKAEEAKVLEAMKLKKQFTSVICHELRTPLNGVIGILTYLNDEETIQEHKQMLTLALKSAQSLDTLFNDMLEFSELEHNKLKQEKIAFSPQFLVLSVYNTLLLAAQNKGLEMPTPVTTNLPDMAVGYEGAIRHILLNLASNAIKFTERGRVSIEANYERVDANSGRLNFVVSDTGPGISPADHDKIFEAYVQLDGTLTRKYGGVGLGLSLAKQLIDHLNGTITVDSAFGRGATFRASIPLTSS